MRPVATTVRRPSRRAALFAALAVATVTAVSTVSAVPAPAIGSARSQPLSDQSVSVTVLDVSPSTPARSAKPIDLTLTLGLVNTTDQALADLRIEVERGAPIENQEALDAAIADPQPSDESLVAPIELDTPVTATLDAEGSATLTYKATTGIDFTAVDICLCHNAIYPLYVTVHYTDPDGADLVVGSTQTYLPAFGETDPPLPVRVSWVWPIIDRPHRLTDDTVFINDDLATSVRVGRLDRVLRVVEAVAEDVPMTLVVDPDLIDELQVMATLPYQVAPPGATPQPGSGKEAAAAWLDRLRLLLDAHPALQFEFTPFADPDVESLTRNALSWTVGMSTGAAGRVSDALGGRTPTNRLAWPAGEELSPDTLDLVRRYGASTVILGDHAFPMDGESPTPDAFAPLQTSAGPVTAAVTSSSIEELVGPVLKIGGTGAADLPKLVAQVAIRAVEDPVRSPYVVITAPRYVDPSSVAVRAIRDTAHTLWSTPMTVGAAEQSVPAVDHGPLVPPKQDETTLPAASIEAALRVNASVPSLSSMLDPADATNLLSGLPVGVQRAGSSAWREAPVLGTAYADQLTREVQSLDSGVFIVNPSSGTYTLASANSPLPLAITNRLDVAVRVRVRVSTVNSSPGFSARDIGVQEIAPHTTLTLRIPVSVQRSGRFQVHAELFAPDGAQLGPPVFLSVRSTALGTIGVVITVVAAGVLLLALLVRLYRRFRGRGRPRPVTARPAVEP